MFNFLPYYCCQDCQCVKSDVQLVVSPYVMELLDIEELQYLCDDCVGQQWEDV